jgi:hypothetical protein
MATFALTTFGGMIPLRGEQKRPLGASQYADNCNLESADLMPVLSPTLVSQASTTAFKAAFRIPAALRGDIAAPPPASSYSPDDFWFWTGPAYSHLCQTPLTNDQYRRWYWTQENVRPLYAPFSDMQTGASYPLGVPRPDTPLVVAPAVPPPNIPLTFFDPATDLHFPLTAGYVDVVYFRQFLVEGGLAPYVFEVTAGALPPSLALSETRGTLAGVPSVAGTYNFTVRVTDELGATVSRAVTISVNPSPYTGLVETDPLTERVAQPPNGIDGVSYTHSFAAEGGKSPRSFRVIRGAIPPGLVLTSQGVLYGVPDAPGYYLFTLEVFDANGDTAARQYDIEVRDSPLTPESPFIFVTRCYVYTFVSDFGEESAPSEPVCDEGAEGEPWALTTPIELPVGAGDFAAAGHINKKRIYRTVTGTTGGSFFFVAEIPLAQAGFDDNVPTDEVSLNEQLRTDAWDVPPETLVGLVAHPNGFFIGYTAEDSTLHFSEPYYPHAWPAQYSLSVEGKIQGIAVSNGQIIVLTTTAPQVLYGPVPAALTKARSSISEPCISRFGIAATPFGVFYPSKNGLCMTDGRAVQIATTGILSYLDWQAYAPDSLFMARHKNAMIGIPLAAPSFAFAPSQPNAQFSELRFFAAPGQLDPVPDNLQTDPYSQEVYWVEGGQAWLYDSDTTLPTEYSWLSSEIVVPKPINWAVFAVDMEPYYGSAEEVYVLFFDVEANTLRHGVTITESGTYRLPAGYKTRVFQIGLVGSARVKSFKMADTGLGLAAI